MSDPRIQVDKALTPLGQALKQEEEESRHREFRIALTQNTEMDSAKPDQSLPANQRNSEVKANAHISEKIYLFPEEFNALRRELEENWPNFFHTINPDFGFSPAWAMVYKAPEFVGFCNGALDMVEQFDSENVAGLCKKFLNGFRKMRGVSAL